MSTESVIDLIGDALATEINSLVPYSPAPPAAVNAQRASAQLSQFENLPACTVLVIPDANRHNPLLDRARNRGFRYGYDLLWYAKVAWLPTQTVAENNAAIDPWKLVVQQTADWFLRSMPLGEYAGAQPVDEVPIDPICDEAFLFQYGLFLSMAKVTVFLQRQM